MAYASDPTGRGRKARTITVTDPLTGAQITRRTERVYVAAVVVGSPGAVHAVTWAGRPDLAAKALAKYGGAANGYRLAPVTSDPWATPEPTPAEPVAAEPAPAPQPVAAEPVAAPEPLSSAAVVALLCRKFPVSTPATYQPAVARLEARGAAVTPLSVLQELNRPAPAEPAAPVAAEPARRRPVLPGEAQPPAAPAPPGAAAPTLPTLRADAAAGRPVSLAALAAAITAERSAPTCKRPRSSAWC